MGDCRCFITAIHMVSEFGGFLSKKSLVFILGINIYR
jgi:hypothetical protein